MTTQNLTDGMIEHDFFRCALDEAHSRGRITVGRKTATVQVQDTSIDGFTVLISKKEAGKLKVGQSWILEHDGTRFEVNAQWFFNAPDGTVQVGLRRLRDLTPPPKLQCASLWGRLGGGVSQSATSAAGFGGFVMVLFCAMALPGLGEQLGTAARIQGAVRWLFFEASSVFTS
ncbi:hypothetical protein N9N28_02565 [Rubripirellula amarantea]|nr:hypothetical protein [Rubripirellula amarantea]MDA8743493.1 hypothetical protein [Rubripirellula amarantea]